MIRILSLFILMILFQDAVYCQSPGREFRAVWVASIANIDWPSKPGLSSHEQKDEIIKILNHHKKKWY